MKTKIVILGAAVFAAMSLPVLAVDTLSTPRAAATQLRVVKSTEAVVASTPARTLTSPRAASTQAPHITGVASDSNPAAQCQKNMTTSPKASGECSSHTTMPGCMKVASAK